MFVKILVWDVGCNVAAVLIIKDIHLYEVVHDYLEGSQLPVSLCPHCNPSL